MTLRRLPVLLPLLLFIAMLAGLLLATLRPDARLPGFASHLNQPAPLTDLPRLDADTARFRRDDWAGRAYVINFFASWCLPCRAEQPALALLMQAQVPVIGIAYKDKPADVTAFLRSTGDPFAVIATDAAGRAGIDWGITGVPESFLIDRFGIIRFHQAGPLTTEIVNRQILPLWQGLAP